jgi:purine-binding chemotaxis protein CheW
MSSLHVICKIANAEYAVPADDVFQMESFSGVTTIPGAAPFVIGLVQVRQQVVPVIDARLRFGLEAIPPTSESRLVILRAGKRLVGMLVDSAREVENIPVEQFQASPEVLGNQATGFVKSVAQLKGRIIMLIDSMKVIGEETANG